MFTVSTLRWAVKDDRGCKNPAAPNYSEWATVYDGSCILLGPLESIELKFGSEQIFGQILIGKSSLKIFVKKPGLNEVKRGHYFVRVKVNGHFFQERVSIK